MWGGGGGGGGGQRMLELVDGRCGVLSEEFKN